MNAKSREEIGADIVEVDFQGCPGAFKKVTPGATSVVGDLLECFVLLLPRTQVQVSCAAIQIRRAVDTCLVDGHKPLCVRIRQGPQENIIHNCEHSGCRSNTEGERRDYRSGESR